MHTIKGEPLIRKWAPILSYCPDRSISNILYGFTLHCPEDSPSSTFATFPPTFTKRYGWQAHYVSTRRAACCLWTIQCQKNAEQRGRHHLRRQIPRTLPARNPQSRSCLSSWIAYKFTPKIPKQERFVKIAQAYHSVHLDVMLRKSKEVRRKSRYLGEVNEKRRT